VSKTRQSPPDPHVDRLSIGKNVHKQTTALRIGKAISERRQCSREWTVRIGNPNVRLGPNNGNFLANIENVLYMFYLVGDVAKLHCA
jgi:hypothetical protein